MKKKISDLRVADLKQELEKRGFESKGLKGVLVQRLQKALEDEGLSTSEIEISGPETASPKVQRRGTPRSKRSNGEATDTSQEDNSTTAALVTEPEKSDNVAEDHPSEKVEESDVTGEGSIVVPDGNKEVLEEQPMEESLGGQEDLADGEFEQEEEDLGNQEDEQITEEDASELVNEEVGMEPTEGSELTEIEEVEQIEEVSMEPKEGEYYGEEYEHGDEIATEVVQEVESVDEVESSEVNAENETIEFQKTEIIEEIIEGQTKIEAEKKKHDQDVVATEVDVLDMLDYDLDITSDQNTLGGSVDDLKSAEQKSINKERLLKSTAANQEEMKMLEAKGTASSDDKKSRPSSVSQKTSPDNASTSSQSPAKSGGGKESAKTASGKSAAAVSKKEENSNKNLWISGLSSSTRASELKSAFSRYGKVIGAKVVTNVKSPGSRCYGYVTMASAEAANKCILHLNNTEMHGKNITVEIAKNDPSASSKKQAATSNAAKKEAEMKDEAGKTKDGELKVGAGRRNSASGQALQKSARDAKGGKDGIENKKTIDQSKDSPSGKKSTEEEKHSGRSSPRNRVEKSSAGSHPTPRSAGEKRTGHRSPINRSTSRQSFGRDEPERKRTRQPNSADRKVVMDSNKGELRVNVSGTGRVAETRNARWEGDGRPKPLMTRRRSTSPQRRRSVSPQRNVLSRANLNSRGPDARAKLGRGRGSLLTRQMPSGGRGRGNKILSFNEIRAQQRVRERGRNDRGRPERGGRIDRGRVGFGRGGNMSQAHQLQTERERLRREREEREKLRIERERLERERRQLEKDRLERERLEQERLRLEAERKRELERIEREKAEMRRLQEITRYQVEQRQRAIKRTYDDDTPGHRGRSGRDSYDTKRPMMSERDISRRGEREDRRYDNFNSRESRNGPQQGQSGGGYRQSQSGSSQYRSVSGHGKPNASYHDSRRSGGMAPDSHHDGDVRYGGSGTGGMPSRAAAQGRNVEKFPRRESGNTRAVEYGHSYDREAGDDTRHVSDGAAVRRRGHQREQAGRDGRKVITREKSDHGSSPDFRRNGSRPAGARVEITRVEHSPPPARRPRRDASPPSSGRSATWRDTKGGISRREDERDLREQIRRPTTARYSSNRERGNQRRAASPTSSGSDSPGRPDTSYSARWAEGSADSSSSQQIYTVNSGLSGQASRSGSANAWGHVAQWQQGMPGSRSWPAASTLSTSASSVSRQMLGSGYGSMAPTSTLALQPPGTTNIIPPTQTTYITDSDRQNRSFQAFPKHANIQRY